MGPWFVWNYTGYILVGLSVLFVLVRFYVFPSEMPEKTMGIVFLGILTYFVVDFRDFSIWRVVLFFCHITVFFLAIQMREPEKEKLVRMVTMVYAWIIGISIIFYVFIVILGVDFPHFPLKHPNAGYPKFRNYKFLVVPVQTGFSYYRFRSIFTEPGHLGTIAALLLYVNKYEVKKKSVFIILAGLLLSLSVAAYVLLIFGYGIYQFAVGKQIYKKIIIVVSIVVLLGGVGLYLSNEYPDSIVTNLIVNRLRYDEKKGVTGNNRTTPKFDYYYTKYFLGTSDMVLGTGPRFFQKKFSWGIGSYKSFFLSYGFFGMISLFLFYYSMARSTDSRILFGLFLLYCVSFWQRPYALWEMQLFMFWGATEVFKSRKIKAIALT
jgi:hypothetical protein